MKKRILSLVLCAALLLSLCLFMGAGAAVDAPDAEGFVPAVNFTNVAPLVQANAQAAGGPARAPMLTANVNAAQATDKGVVTSKTAAKNADGTYTITLEAYATGSKVITEIQKDVPTDIVLVLDQSGSMADDMGTVKYEKYKDRDSTNTQNYGRRHNGGSANLWYPLPDGTYVSVNVGKSQAYTALPTSLKNYEFGECYWDYKDTLYEKVGDAYQKVTVDDKGNFIDGYTYTYTFSDGHQVVSKGNSSVPNFGSRGPLYTLAADGDSTVYTYTYTDADGVTQTIGTSTGANERYAKFYQRSVSSSGGGTRLAALKSAATEFANSVATKAAGKDGVLGTEDDIDHRIAVVGFADTDEDYGYNTGVFIGKTMTKYSNASSVYATALQSMKTTEGKNNVTASLDALQTSGATRTDLGMEMAKGILDANPVPADQTRNRVVIVFTDGSPTDFSGFQVNVANSAISTANTIKSGGATVYGIGIFAGADATSPGTKPTSNLGNNSNSSALSAACNCFMQNLSSNNGVVQNPSYYLSAADAESLKNIFKQISDQIETGGSSTTLSSEAVVKDIISQQFCLPAGTTAEQIRLQTYACTGKTGDKYQWSKTDDGNKGAVASIRQNGQVSVTGFDFAGNWCGVETQTDGTEVARGHKLVISFEVVPKDGFLGGNDVFTNANAAIYANSTAQLPVATFERPQVNVPIKSVAVTAQEQNVYLLGGVTVDALKAGTTAMVGGVALNLSEDNYGLDTWQTEYVDITVSVTDADGNVITNLSDLKDDVTYSVAVKVAPKTTSAEADAATEQAGSSTANVNVFKPELTFRDSEGYYGDTAPAFDGNLTATAWKHNGAEADTDVMGAAPVLTISYTPDTDAVVDGKINTRTDFGVAASVKIGDTDVTEHTGFHHTSCEGKTCTLPEGKAFLCHVNTCSLTISKTVTGQNNGQSFVFTVKDANGNVITTVAVKGGASKTITGLPIGTYTVTEDTQWSWQYNLTSGNDVTKELKANAAEDHAAADFTNEYKGTNWLTSIADVINTWISGSAAQKN